MPIEAADVRLAQRPDGSLEIGVASLVVRDVRAELPAASVEAARVELRNATMTTAAGGPGVAGVAADELRLEGAKLSATPPKKHAGSGTGWRLDAIGGLDGTLDAFVTDAAWVVDAEVKLPIADGRIDFDRVVVEHVGPNSSMGVSHMGVYVDAPNGRTYLYVFAMAHVPGVTFERRGALFGSQVMDRGAIELRPLLECVLRSGGGKPIGSAPHHVVDTLDRTRLRGEVRLGDGALGTEHAHVVLSGHAQAMNRVALSAAVVSDRLVAQVPSLQASEATFEWDGKRVASGPVAGAMHLLATGLGRPGAVPQVVLTIDRLTLQRLRIGGA